MEKHTARPIAVPRGEVFATDASSPFRDALSHPVQQEKRAPCHANCIAGSDVRGWIARIAQHEKIGITLEQALTDAWTLIAESNPLPASIARICPHPCEDACNRADKDGALAIHALERFVGDWGVQQGLTLPVLERGPHEERIGVIGAGPAGLSFAYQMRRRGYPVTVYERNAQAGGMLRYGIPGFRLPSAILDAEIQRIADLGVEFRTGISLGVDVTLDQLREDYDALFLGIGANGLPRLGIPGEEGPGIWTGTELLHLFNEGKAPRLGQRVVVIGGGNAAIDAARAARRLGSDVTVLYRRSREEMPALDRNVEDALSELVQIEYLAIPREILRGAGGAIRAVGVQHAMLGGADSAGRALPLPVPSAHFVIETDAVIVAISHTPERMLLPDLPFDDAWPVSDDEGRIAPGLWAAGDVLGLGVAALALAEGQEAARRADAQLRGHEIAALQAGTAVSSDRIDTEYFEARPPVIPPRAPIDERLLRPLEEIDWTLSEDAFLEEVSRCLSCGQCFGCGQCRMYCNASAFVPLHEVRPGAYFALSDTDCEGCGKCIEICPTGFLSLRD